MTLRHPADAHTVPPGSILLVVHDFIARSPDELSLAKGDRIELIERDDDFGDGWFLGRHMTNASTGLFPEVYTTPAPKATLPVSSNQQRNPRPSPLSPPLAASIPNISPAPPAAAQLDFNPENVADRAVQRPLSSSNALPTLRNPNFANPPAARVTNQPAPHNSVMHETLSVIDEHITDLRGPRRTQVGAANRNIHDMDSFYNSQIGSRLSYINGHETDEEEESLHTEAEVMAWSPARVALYLEEHGVEKQHCETFREQEISGQVLLGMEQSAVFIKEFELGSVGRRLKTWQKIKALQDEVRAAAIPDAPRSVSDYSAAGDDSMSDFRRRRSASTSTLPRKSVTATTASIPTVYTDRPTSLTRPVSSQTIMSSTSRSDVKPRPSAHSIRSLNHSRRHSSVGSIDTGYHPAASRFSHHRQTSSSTSAAAAASAIAAARRRSSVQDYRASVGPSTYDDLAVPNYGFGSGPESSIDFDRGYFSGNEVDDRHRRNVLQKRAGTAATESARRGAVFANNGRMDSIESLRGPTLPLLSPIISPSSAQFPIDRDGGNRAVSSPQATTGPKLGDLQGATSPIVTKLDYGQSPLLDSDASSANHSPSPASMSFSFFSKPRISNLRITSDAITQNEKRAQSGLKGSPLTSPTRTGSTTPSTIDAQSFEIPKPDAQSRVSTGSSSALAPPPPPTSTRSRPKAVSRTKKTTSAYTRGLEKKTPAEQIAGCDYSGWMKKRSSNLVGTWKPRLFVLRGRRLSYYYSENDTEEKGLIDISSHRVLPAENEKITGLHATLTGASSSPIIPLGSTTATSAASDLASKPAPASEQGLFIFKLVPPRQGLSKAVNFTKPAVHYFAVNSRQEGRLWMAALMKATIDYDASGNVITSYNQKTISLAKARARNERPPALREISTEQEASSGKTKVSSLGETEAASSLEKTGLGIDGLEAGVASEDAAAAAAAAAAATVGGAEKTDAESTTAIGTSESVT